jgi:hypothetical protein
MQWGYRIKLVKLCKKKPTPRRRFDHIIYHGLAVTLLFESNATTATMTSNETTPIINTETVLLFI